MSYPENEDRSSQGSSPLAAADSPPPPTATTEYAEVRKDAFTSSISAAATNKSAEPTEEVPFSKTSPLFCTVFTICGCSALFYWNALLNMIFDVSLLHFPNYPKIGDTLTAFFGTCNLISVCVLSWRGGLNFSINVGAGVMLALMSILTPVVIIYMPERSAMYLLHVIAVIAGSCVGCFQGGHFALAGSLPRNYTAWVSTGNGVGGVFTFALWMIFSQAAFPDDVDKSLWTTMAIGAALLLFAATSVFFFYHRPDVYASISKMRERARAARKDPNRLRYFAAFKLCWKPLACIVFMFFVTLLLFPNIGPLRWNAGSVQTNVVMGMFQLGDLIGRYIPTLARHIPWVVFDNTGLFWASVAHCVYVVIFFLIWRIHNAAFASMGMQVVMMLTFAIISGWFSTVGLVRTPQAIANPEYKYRGGALSIAALLLGLTIGLWTSKLITYLVEK